MKGIFYIHYNAPGDNLGGWVFGDDGTIDTAFAALAVGASYQGGILKYAAKWMNVVTTADGLDKLTGQLESSIGSAYGDVGPIYTNQTLSGGGTPDSPLILAQQGASDGQVLKWNNTLSVWEPETDTAGTGDVVGPASSTDEAVARYNLATGKLLQNSVLLVSDTGAVSGATTLAIGGALTGATTITASGEIKGDTLAINDSNDSHKLTILTTSNLTADHTLTLVPGDADRSVTLAGDLNVSGAATISGTNTGDQLVKCAVNGRVQAIAQNLTRYVPLNSAGAGDTPSATDPSADASGIEDLVWVAPYAGTVRNLYGRVSTAPAAGQTFTLTVMKNGAAQTLTCQFTDAGVTANDTSNSFSVVAGDRVSMRVVTTATSGDYGGSFSVELRAT